MPDLILTVMIGVRCLDTRLMRFDLATAKSINPYDRCWSIAIFVMNITYVGPRA